MDVVGYGAEHRNGNVLRILDPSDEENHGGSKKQLEQNQKKKQKACSDLQVMRPEI